MDNFDLMRITVGPFSTSSLHTTFLMEFNNHFFEIGKDAAELLNLFILQNFILKLYTLI